MVRTALFRSGAHHADACDPVLSLKHWALNVAKRRGMKRAKVALARKLGVVLHRMWVDATDFRWSKTAAMAIGEEAVRSEPKRQRSPEVPSPGRGLGKVVCSAVNASETTLARLICQLWI